MTTLPLNRRTSRLIVSSESLPTRMSDLRFLALDECDRLARAERAVVMRKGFDAQVVQKDERTTRLDVSYSVVAYPLPGWDEKVAEKIRALDFDADALSVIADF